MDPRIEGLKSTTFFGKRLTRRQIALIQETVQLLPKNSCRELARTICEHQNWLLPGGGYREQFALRALEELEVLGILELPAKRNPGSVRKRPAHTARSDPGPAIDCDLRDLEPLALEPAFGKAAGAEWTELVDRHHYLGYASPIGQYMRYFVVDASGRRLGCLMFEASGALACRDAWIGWTAKQRDAGLRLVARNSRFLVFPWVEVKNLASRSLALAARRLAEDWEGRWGYRPVLAETFVDPERFEATCYRAANWSRIGRSAGGGSKKPKDVYALALDIDFRAILKGEGKPAKPKPKRKRKPEPDDALEAAWMRIVDAAGRLASAHDGLWMRRRRTLSTLIVMLFVFRLVLSRGSKGYATVVGELWEQCRKLAVELPQRDPVVASSICKARKKVDANLFLDLHREILRQGDEGGGWKGHRIHAVDGSKMNLPRKLAEAGYAVPSGAHYPQGLVSCLYRLDTKMPIDFSITADANERAAALAHFDALKPNDVVVFDRGYFSYELLYDLIERGAHPVFRLQRGIVPAFDEFRDGDRDDAILNLAPGPNKLRELRGKHPGRAFGPVKVRLVRYEAGGEEYCLATTLLDAGRYGVADLSDLYHGRWSIEELYKISKNFVEVNDFHARSERGVRQELYAHFCLIAATRLFANDGDGLLEQLREEGKFRQTVNFKNALAVVAANLEELLLTRAKVVAETVSRMAERILAVRSRLRPWRSYPRRSMKAAGKWSRRGEKAKVPKAPAAQTA